jgi:hypothetical protein
MKHRWLPAVAGLAVLAMLALVVPALYDEAKPPSPQPFSLAPMPGAAAPLHTAPQAKAPVAAAAAEQACGDGLGNLDAPGPAADPDALDARLVAAADRARPSLWAALAASSDEVARAVGLWAQSLEVPARDLPDCISGRCVQSYFNAWARRLQANEAPRAGLARMAQTTQSPQVYALARDACQVGGLAFGGACHLLSVEQWARLDPDNALPWLTLAQQSKTRGDAAGVDEAVFRATHARSARGVEGVVMRAALSLMPPGTPPRVQEVLLTQLAGSAFVNRQTSPPPEYCSAASVQDGNRRQTCANLGEMLATRSETLVDMLVGVKIAERAGLPLQRIAAWGDELDAMLQLGKPAPDGADRPQQAPSCESAEDVLRWHRELAHGGELHTLRNALQRSGLSTAELARRYRESMQTMQVATPTSAAASATP